MVHLYFMPNWFVGYNILLHIIFCIITLLVSLFAFRVHKMSGQRQPKLFSIAFLFVSLAFFIESIMNLLILAELNEHVTLVLEDITSIALFNFIINYAHIILFSIGLVTLAYMTFRVRSAKIYSLLLIITLVPLFFTSNPLYLYYLTSSILLIYILAHYLINYLGKKQTRTLLVLFAFLLLLFGNIQVFFSISNHEIYYVIGHFIELIAYLLILMNLMLVLKHEQKARPAPGHS